MKLGLLLRAAYGTRAVTNKKQSLAVSVHTLLLGFLLFYSFNLNADSLSSEQTLYALTAERLIDGSSDTAHTGLAVLVKGERIVDLVALSQIPSSAQIIDLGDATLMPGLIDTHSHPLIHASDYQTEHLQTSSAYKSLKALKAVQGLLHAGWTSLRIMGDSDVAYGAIDLQRSIAEGIHAGPRITAAAHYLSITGGGGDINYLSPEQSIKADGLVVDGPEEIRKAIRREVKYGSEWIKLLVTGAFMSANDNPRNVAFSPEELQVAFAEAKRLGVPVAAHAHAAEGIKQAVLAGARSIEHGSYMDDEAIALMAKHKTFLVPTAYIGDYYADPRYVLREQDRNDDYLKNYRHTFLELIGKAHKRGVKIAVGVDLGGLQYDPSVSVRELQILHEAGLSKMDAIKAASSVGAELLNWQDRVGRLEPGLLADIIAVPGNPLLDLEVMEHVRFVMLGGKVIKSE